MKRHFAKFRGILFLSVLLWIGLSVSVLAADYTLSIDCSDRELMPDEQLIITIGAEKNFHSADITVKYDSSCLTFDKTDTALKEVALVQESVPGIIRLMDYGKEKTGYTMNFQIKTPIAEETKTIIQVESASFGSAVSAATADASVVPEMASVELTVTPQQYAVTFEKIAGYTGVFPEDTMLSGKEDYTFRVPSIANYTVSPMVSINGGAERKPAIENDQVTIPKEAVIGDIKVRFDLSRKNECAGTADNGYKTVHQFLAEPAYTWNGFASCSAIQTCDCGGSTKRGYAEATAEVVENGQRRRYTAVFESPFTTQYKYGDPITVTFRLIGDYLHGHENAETAETLHTAYVTWIPETEYRVYQGMTVGDVFRQALTASGMAATGAKGDWEETGYVAGIRAPEVLGGDWLREKNNGAYSGWLYSVNGVCPSFPLTECELTEKDRIVWFYSDNFEREKSEKTWLKAENCTPETYLWENCSVKQNGESQLVLEMPAVPQNTQILAAVYNGDGRMTDIRLITAQMMMKNAAGRVQTELGSAEENIIVFFTDKTTIAPKRDNLKAGTVQ